MTSADAVPSGPLPAPSPGNGPREIYEWLIRPLSAAEFERSYYERRTLLVRRSDPAYYQGLLTLEDLDRVLGTHSVRHPDLNVVKLGTDIPASQFAGADNIVDPLRVARFFSEGATVIFSHLEGHVPALAAFCTALCRMFSSKMQTNIYLTPPRAQGFAPHWDTHDTFIMQVAGSKHWSIYDTLIELPMRGQQFDHKKHKPGDVSMEFELKAGDFAYVPRGAFHSARSTEEMSLHITLGLMAFTWADLLLQGVAEAAEEDVSLRANLPFAIARADFPPEERARLIREKLARVVDYVESNPPLEEFFRDLRSHNRPLFDNLLSQVTGLERLGPGSIVRARPDARWDAEELEDTCIVEWAGHGLSFPRFVAPALAFIRQTPSFAVGDLPVLDLDGKLTLVRRLIKEGLLERLA